MSNKEAPLRYAFHVESDGSISPHNVVPGTSLPEIPPGVYTLVFVPPTPMREMRIFLRPENNFRLPDRLYGNINLNVDRFLKSYELNDKNLGTLFVGEQGSGKTMLLKALAVKAVQMGFPVILVDEKIPGEVLNWFASTIIQNVLFCFDEFEKTYKEMAEQAAILKMLDGTNTGTKKMYCLTANNIKAVSPHLVNRPSRIRYVLTFRRLEVAAVVDYVQTNLKGCTESHLRAFLHLALADGLDSTSPRESIHSNGMNFDSMCEYVREMNQFGGTLNDTLAIMGLNGTKSWTRFEVSGFVNGERKYRAMATGTHQGAYAQDDNWEISFSIQKEAPKENVKEGEEDWPKWNYESVFLTSADFKSFGDSYEVLVFEKDGVEYHLRYIDFNSSARLRQEVEAADEGKRKRPQAAKLTMTQMTVPASVEFCDFSNHQNSNSDPILTSLLRTSGDSFRQDPQSDDGASKAA